MEHLLTFQLLLKRSHFPVGFFFYSTKKNGLQWDSTMKWVISPRILCKREREERKEKKRKENAVRFVTWRQILLLNSKMQTLIEDMIQVGSWKGQTEDILLPTAFKNAKIENRAINYKIITIEKLIKYENNLSKCDDILSFEHNINWTKWLFFAMCDLRNRNQQLVE